MRKKYNTKEYNVPKLVICMPIYNNYSEVSYYGYYSLDTSVIEALIDFFQSMQKDYPSYKITENSRLIIAYIKEVK